MEKLTVLCSCKQNLKLKYKHRHTVAATGSRGFKINWKLNKTPYEANHDRSCWSRGGEVHGSSRGGHWLGDEQVEGGLSRGNSVADHLEHVIQLHSMRLVTIKAFDQSDEET